MNIVHKLVIDENNIENVENLYHENGWTAYSNNRQKLINAINNSYNISIWEEELLVALIRVVTDMETILYIQDILVLPYKQRKGYGSLLIKEVESKFSNVKQKVLLTDESKKTRSFYESLNYKSCDDGVVVAFMKYI
ncbi:MAG: GNAT family N-acetyltransferase [Acidaminobacteraceae bacterium]